MPKWLESKFAAMKISRQLRRDVYFNPYVLSSTKSDNSRSFSSFSERANVQERHASLNSNSLRCFQCQDELTSRIYQCTVGHLYCYDCKIIQKICPSCAEDITYDTDPSSQKNFKTSTIKCSHAGFGCDFKPHPLDLESHSKECIYRPCPCPLQECKFEGPSNTLWQHLYSFHCNSRELVIWTSDENLFQCKKNLLMGYNNQNVLLRCCSSTREIKLLLHMEIKPLGIFIGVRCFTSVEKEKELGIKISLKRNDGKKGRVTFQGRPKSVEQSTENTTSSMFHFRKRFLQLNSLGQFMLLFELSVTNNKIK